MSCSFCISTLIRIDTVRVHEAGLTDDYHYEDDIIFVFPQILQSRNDFLMFTYIESNRDLFRLCLGRKWWRDVSY